MVKKRRGSVALVVLAAALWMPLQASATATCGGSLGTAGSYNVFLRRTADFDMGSVGGRTAIGTDSRIGNANFGTQLAPNPSRLDLISGNNLDFSSGSLQNGSGTYGGTATLGSGVSSPHGTITHAPPPFNFSTEFTSLQAASTTWASVPPNGTTTVSSGVVKLTGTDPSQNVFSVTASQLSTASEIDIRVPVGATVLINMSGTSLSDHGQNVKFWTGAQYESAFGNPGTAATVRNATLFNGPDLTTIDFGNTNWDGSILAPQAAAHIMVTGFYGQLIADSFSPTTQNSNFYNNPFNGNCLPPNGPGLPPTGIGMLGIVAIAALGLAFIQWRSRRDLASAS